jgi:hypothetical protein
MGMLQSLFGASSTEPETSPKLESARARLAETFVERDRCRSALENATAHLERVHRVLEQAAGADVQLEAEEARAAAASQRWASGGAVGEPETEAFGAASEARSRAYALRLQATGAKAALPDIERSVNHARSALESAEGAIRTAAIDTLVIEAEKDFLLLEESMPAIKDAVLSLRGLRILTAGWGKSPIFRGFDGSSASPKIAERLAEFGFPEPKDMMRSLATGIPAMSDKNELLDVEKQWLERANQLVIDPHAK